MIKVLEDKAAKGHQLPETPVSRALKRRKELQDEIKTSMKELEKIEEFLRMYRTLSGDDDTEKEGAQAAQSRYILGGAGTGQTQAFFEQLARTVLLEAGRPMRSPEIIDAFKERGHPIGGNETRTAWNRLWQAKKNNVLVNISNYGYWLADEPLPQAALAAPPPKRRVSAKPKNYRGRGNPIGRQRVLTASQIKTLEGWLEEGKMTRAEMARELGGISLGTISNYRVAWLNKRPEDDLPNAKRASISPKKKKK